MNKINRILLSILLITNVIISGKDINANNIDKTRARDVAAYFLSSQFGDKSITANTLRLVYEIPNAELNIPALYVFNADDERGFVIVSGSDCVSPIVAYSTDGSFDPNNIPPNMMWWLNEQVQPIVYAQNNELEAVDEVKASWRQLDEQALPYFGTSSKATKVLLTSTWNQWPLYNNMCPVMNGNHSVTGCVATAMAQIIYYWRYPIEGKASNSYSWNGTTVSADFSNTHYDYDNMVDALTSSSTQEQIDAVALLSFHCGVSVNMYYTDSLSGTSSDKVPKAFRMYFKYHKDSMDYISRSDAPYYNANSTTTANAKDSAWVDVIRAEIIKNRPVYYSGKDPNGGQHAGHAFVCDGYNDQTGTLHFNWGWGGSGDCYCNVYKSKLKPSNSIGGRGYNFTADHRACIGITPPKDSIQNVGIREVETPFTAAIYPNPANERITVSYQLSDDNNATMQIFDIAGLLVEEKTLTHASTQITINVSGYTPGIYVCRIGGYSKKFIVK